MKYMIVRPGFFSGFFFFFLFQSLCAVSLAEQFKQVGYRELCNKEQGTKTFESLYASFDELVEFLQKNPSWVQKLCLVKDRFIRCEDRNFYSTDFFGFYDESHKGGRSQIYFYYSIHFHEFICSRYPEFKQAPKIMHFLDACLEIQKPYGLVFDEAAAELGLKTIFSSKYGHPPVLLKVIKYLPSYVATRPHYDGTALTLLLDSTDNQSLLLSPYKHSVTAADFSAPARNFSRCAQYNSMLLIPGAHLEEFSIYPTPHTIASSGRTRYATVVFAMRPHHIFQKSQTSPLPCFTH